MTKNSSGNEAVAGQSEAEREISGFADADARQNVDSTGGEAVILDVETGVAIGDVNAVVHVARDPQRLTEPPRTRGKQARISARLDAAETGHGVDPLERLQSAEQEGTSLAFGLAADVQAIVHTVDEVDISEAGRSEEDGVAAGFAGKGMSSLVVQAAVSFDFDDAAGKPFAFATADKDFPEKGARDLVGWMEVERARNDGGTGHLFGG